MFGKTALACTTVILTLAVSGSAFAGGLNKPVSKNPEARKLIEQAWALQKSDYTTEIFKRCIDWMEQANKLDPDNNSILTDLARYYWQYGDSLPKTTEDEKNKLEELFARGEELAERSLEIRETSDGHYWHAVNLAAGLEFSSIFSQAAAFPSIYSHTQYVLEHDPDYDYGAPGRLWAEILSRVPKKVVELVGEKYVEEALREIDRSIEKWPNFLDNHVFKARFVYTYYGDRDAAIKLLDTALRKDPNCFPEEATPNRYAQRNGKKLWKTITGKHYPER